MFAFTKFDAFVPVQTGAPLSGFAGFADEPHDEPRQAADWMADGGHSDNRIVKARQLERPSAFVNALASVNEALDQLHQAERALEEQLSDLRGYIDEVNRRPVALNAG